jgi:hypothetical protein
MQSGEISACSVRLLAGRRVLAHGRATAAKTGTGALTVRLALTKQGRVVLAHHLGGVRGSLVATAATSGGSRSRRARTRAVLAVEHFVTPPGSWVPDRAALSPRGRRFLRSLSKRLVAVAAVRCDGYSAKVGAEALRHSPISRARATAVCAALHHLGINASRTVAGRGNSRPIASNATESGRARNRRVEVTITHRHTRL